MKLTALIAIFSAVSAVTASTIGTRSNQANEALTSAHELDSDLALEPEPKPSPSSSSHSRPLQLAKRRAPDFKATRVDCTHKKKVDWINAMAEGRRLYVLDGAPRLGPGQCSRVGCSTGTAIVWCNEGKEVLKLNSWDEVADGAWVVINQCRFGDFGDWYVAGTAYHAGDWKVTIRTEKC
ncbi:hypothetical protein BDW74DRAFT_179979 [Aspergillus multicolor]|uniref:uncharacterized protein n=1 Tax=Aspergillus multicolor TaxID=41759 RepID=UPI003CCD3591